MIDYDLNRDYLENLFKRYPKINQIILDRTLKKVDNFNQLFDALETFPYKYPVIWHKYKKIWEYTTDLTQVASFEGGMI